MSVYSVAGVLDVAGDLGIAPGRPRSVPSPDSARSRSRAMRMRAASSSRACSAAASASAGLGALIRPPLASPTRPRSRMRTPRSSRSAPSCGTARTHPRSTSRSVATSDHAIDRVPSSRRTCRPSVSTRVRDRRTHAAPARGIRKSRNHRPALERDRRQAEREEADRDERDRRHRAEDGRLRGGVAPLVLGPVRRGHGRPLLVTHLRDGASRAHHRPDGDGLRTPRAAPEHGPRFDRRCAADHSRRGWPSPVGRVLTSRSCSTEFSYSPGASAPDEPRARCPTPLTRLPSPPPGGEGLFVLYAVVFASTSRPEADHR